jgi:hypothetical protein
MLKISFDFNPQITKKKKKKKYYVTCNYFNAFVVDAYREEEIFCWQDESCEKEHKIYGRSGDRIAYLKQHTHTHSLKKVPQQGFNFMESF